jgi:hypothetical protein
VSAREQVVGAADGEPEHIEHDPARLVGERERERRLADLLDQFARDVLGAGADQARLILVPLTG